MKGELVKVESEDGYYLDGFISRNGREKIVLHVHGSNGSFFNNFFLEDMAKSFSLLDISFCSIGTRGREYYADYKFLSENKIRSKRIGGVREIFQECIYDIGAWINYAKDQGYREIYLQGHSLGAMKTVHYMKIRSPKIGGLILLSPPDHLGLQENDVGDKQIEYINEAQKKCRSDPNLLMSSECYPEDISASSFLSLFSNELDTGMFTVKNIEKMMKSGMSFIDCPIITIIGEADSLLTSSACEMGEKISASAMNSPSVSTHIIKNADHGFTNHGESLANIIQSWLKNLDATPMEKSNGN